MEAMNGELKKENKEMETKPWYQSKVVWFNALYLALAVAAYFGFEQFVPTENSAEVAAVIVSVINIILRLWVTKKPIG